MKCPFCENLRTRVLDSRETEDNTSIRRRRECESMDCGRRFTTYERYEETPLMVVKKDMGREKFEREKVLRGIEKACEKRPVSRVQQEALANSIERKLRNRGDTEVSTTEIGDLVMQYLKGVDEVAYVRFASVYKDFQDIESFARELQSLTALSDEGNVPPKA
jgi:transcriptional repressor NrdR